jgi:parvulin-like peptidyl-prolyl isomerase
MNPETRFSPWVAALMSALSFTVFAQTPVAAPAASAAGSAVAVPAASATTPAAAALAAHGPIPLFATINGYPISVVEFNSAFTAHMRQTYYHGAVPEGGMDKARREVTEQLVNRTLQLQEIARRGLKPDSESIERQVAEYERNYAANPNWQRNRGLMLPGLRDLLGQQDMLKRLESEVRNVPTPTSEEVKAYYGLKPELFTEPEKLRVSAIVLQVDPGAPRAAWDAAIAEAERVARRIRGGADFAEQARLVSNDENAAKGGDLGYLHAGMLPDGLEDRVAKLKTGEVSDPMETLQGIAIFRIADRIPAVLQPFERVADRAAGLLLRERKDEAWQGFLAGLKKGSAIVIHDPAVAAAVSAAK